MNKMIKTAAGTIALSMTAVTLSANANENEDGFYIGANYGYVKVDGADDFDDDSDALQGVVGYRFNPYFAVEGGVIDFGDFDGDLGDVSTDGYTFALKGGIPLTESFGLYAKIGQLWWESDYNVLGYSGSEDDESLFYGLGMAFDITDNVIFNVQYNWYDVDLSADEVNANTIDDDELDSDLHYASLGLEYRF